MKNSGSARVYIPLLPKMLWDDVLEAPIGMVVDDAFLSCCGLPALAQLHGEDRDVAEDYALQSAALKSLADQASLSRPRRVVAVSELEDVLGEPTQNRAGEYRLKRPVHFSEVVSYHVDEAQSVQTLIDYARSHFPTPAKSPATEGETGSESAAFSQQFPQPDTETLPDLLWFDTSELEVLRDFLDG